MEQDINKRIEATETRLDKWEEIFKILSSHLNVTLELLNNDIKFKRKLIDMEKRRCQMQK